MDSRVILFYGQIDIVELDGQIDIIIHQQKIKELLADNVCVLIKAFTFGSGTLQCKMFEPRRKHLEHIDLVILPLMSSWAM